MNSISLNNSSWVIFDNIDLMTAGFTFSYITWVLKIMFCSATLRAIIFEEKEKKTEKKRKKNAFIFGSKGMKTRFLTKKYYPKNRVKMIERMRVLRCKGIIRRNNELRVEIILTKPGGLELDAMTKRLIFAFIFYF
jgi:hypothetical protein